MIIVAESPPLTIKTINCFLTSTSVYMLPHPLVNNACRLTENIEIQLGPWFAVIHENVAITVNTCL
jgi:hypothetical protein